MNLSIMILAVVIVGVIIFFQILKNEKRINIQNMSYSKQYTLFACEILDEIDILMQNSNKYEMIEQKSSKDFEEQLQNIKNELEFIIKSHSNLNNKDRWEEKLFYILEKISSNNELFLKNYEQINEHINSKLQNSMQKIFK